MERSWNPCMRSLVRYFRSASARTLNSRNISTVGSRTPTLRAPPASAFRSRLRTTQRCMHLSPALLNPSKPPKSRDRGPRSEEKTQTDFGALDVLRNTAAPATAIDACTSEGFALNNQMRISRSGVFLVSGEVLRWRPWLQEGRREGTVVGGAAVDDVMTGRLLNAKKQWEVPEDAWGVLELVWPKPDLLIIGTGPHMAPLAPSVRRYLNDLGIRLEVQDTRNAAAQFNLLATERGVSQVAAALIPIGWREGR